MRNRELHIFHKKGGCQIITIVTTLNQAVLSLQFRYLRVKPVLMCFSLSSRITDPILSQHLGRRKMATYVSAHEPRPATETL